MELIQSAQSSHHQSKTLRQWQQISAQDRRLMTLFVQLKGARSIHTHKRYFRVIAQFMMWWDQPLAALCSESMRAYQQYLIAAKMPDPFCQQDELAGDSLTNAQANEQPFRPLKSKTIDDIFSVLKSFCAFLMDESVLVYNPAKNVPRLERIRRVETRNFFSDHQWQLLWAYLEQKNTWDKRRRQHYERIRYCLSIQYGLALRPIEMANHGQRALYPVNHQWKIDILGKGKKIRTLTLPTITIEGIRRYNDFLGLREASLPFLPTLNPVQRKTGKIHAGISEDRWLRIFKSFLNEVFTHAYPQDSRQTWRYLTPHSLRHTRLTHLIKRENRDALEVMKYAGHSNLNTTQIYFHLNTDS